MYSVDRGVTRVSTQRIAWRRPRLRNPRSTPLTRMLPRRIFRIPDQWTVSSAVGVSPGAQMEK